MISITRAGASWNRDWVAGEHGGESFKTTDAIVDIVNPQQMSVSGKTRSGTSGESAGWRKSITYIVVR